MRCSVRRFCLAVWFQARMVSSRMKISHALARNEGPSALMKRTPLSSSFMTFLMRASGSVWNLKSWWSTSMSSMSARWFSQNWRICSTCGSPEAAAPAAAPSPARGGGAAAAGGCLGEVEVDIARAGRRVAPLGVVVWKGRGGEGRPRG